MIQVGGVFLQNTSYLTLKENFFHKPSTVNPKFAQLVIGDDGMPALTAVQGPRTFVFTNTG